MSSLWTPGGEHEVPRDQPAQAQPAAADQKASPPPGGEVSFDDLSPEEQAQAEAMAKELADVRAQIANTPAAVVIANHVMGLYELAAIHLSQEDPNLPEAKAGIDAMGAVIDALDGRLGEHENTLKEAVTQIRMAFVQVSDQLKGAESADD